MRPEFAGKNWLLTVTSKGFICELLLSHRFTWALHATTADTSRALSGCTHVCSSPELQSSVCARDQVLNLKTQQLALYKCAQIMTYQMLLSFSNSNHQNDHQVYHSKIQGPSPECWQLQGWCLPNHIQGCHHQLIWLVGWIEREYCLTLKYVCR